MKCPFCSEEDTQVKDSRPAENRTTIRRRRVCNHCEGRFTTFERIQVREFFIVKRSGERDEFDREKLARSIRIASRKRPIPVENIETLISGIVRELEERNVDEVRSEELGEMVMNKLADLDPVAYIRFASVYRDFQDAKDFDEFLLKLRPR